MLDTPRLLFVVLWKKVISTKSHNSTRTVPNRCYVSFGSGQPDFSVLVCLPLVANDVKVQESLCDCVTQACSRLQMYLMVATAGHQGEANGLNPIAFMCASVHNCTPYLGHNSPFQAITPTWAITPHQGQKLPPGP